MSVPRYDLDHIAIGVPDAAAVTRFVVGRLGGEPDSAGPGFGFRWWQFTLDGGARLEVLEPEGPADGFLHRFLAQRGPGVHHVTFKVPDFQAALARARERGFDVVGESELDPSWKEAFLHPKSAQGVVVQLAESNPSLEPDDFPRPAFVGMPDERPAAARFTGLRLSCRSEARARRLWEETLGGVPGPGNGALAFRWPGSPLRIAVELHPDAEEGPLGLEMAPAEGTRLPEDAALLGTRLLAPPS